VFSQWKKGMAGGGVNPEDRLPINAAPKDLLAQWNRTALSFRRDADRRLGERGRR
jgi:hypothetical protein